MRAAGDHRRNDRGAAHGGSTCRMEGGDGGERDALGGDIVGIGHGLAIPGSVAGDDVIHRHPHRDLADGENEGEIPLVGTLPSGASHSLRLPMRGGGSSHRGAGGQARTLRELVPDARGDVPTLIVLMAASSVVTTLAIRGARSRVPLARSVAVNGSVGAASTVCAAIAGVGIATGRLSGLAWAAVLLCTAVIAGSAILGVVVARRDRASLGSMRTAARPERLANRVGERRSTTSHEDA